MGNDKVLLTQEKYDELQKELEYLITQKRAEVSEKIKRARGFGDLSENAEYDEAKDEQAKVESDIIRIEQQLNKAEIIKVKSNSSKKHVSIGDKVKIKDKTKNRELELTIVGTIEANVDENLISNESPLGKALLNAKEGDIVEVKIRHNNLQYEVLKIIR
ncbi:transcription elongation factor GreA [Helcococcus sueciensis]|uniref:transcription elongation factor GreA n=1 Tax=Helcococcus sueciensis TaxID=241555 RepID=UPI00042570C7|nr:transcription elongation factor GreA [Helcococcus sueciensis]